MQLAVFDTNFEQRLAKIDLGRVMTRVAAETGMDSATLARAEVLYRQYLTLLNRFPDIHFVPPVIVDHVWDAHVMHTRQYAADCDSLFGSFMHHEPHSDDVDLTDDYEALTVPAYMSEFGEDFLMARKVSPALFAAAHCVN